MLSRSVPGAEAGAGAGARAGSEVGRVMLLLGLLSNE